MPQVGDLAPDFTLEGTAGSFTLSSQRGKRVVLLFYPGDFTPVCTKQFCSYAERADDMARLDAVVVGISAQPVERHQEFRDMHAIPVPLLADEDRSVAKAYGVSQPLLGTRRAVFVVDELGYVAHRHVHMLGLDFQTVDDIERVLANMPV